MLSRSLKNLFTRIRQLVKIQPDGIFFAWNHGPSNVDVGGRFCLSNSVAYIYACDYILL